jgi:hypothetical protein
MPHALHINPGLAKVVARKVENNNLDVDTI